MGLTCRVGRAVVGSANMAADVVLSGKSILLLGRPGVGKTTAIRDISSILAEVARKRVVIIDTSNEVAGDGDVPHPGIGAARRMQVTHSPCFLLPCAHHVICNIYKTYVSAIHKVNTPLALCLALPWGLSSHASHGACIDQRRIDCCSDSISMYAELP